MTRDRPQKNSSSTAVQVAIVGAGPAGRWLAYELARQELSVALIDPHIDEPWPNTYGVWLDEIDDLPISVPMQRVFGDAAVRLPQGDIELERPYGLIDNEAFRGMIDEFLQAKSTHLYEASAVELSHGGDESIVYLDDGHSLIASIVVDASGGKAGLLTYGDNPKPGYQRAYGMIAHLNGDPLQGRSMALMDFRLVPDTPSLHSPTFLYGMPLGGNRYFVEETVLVERHPTSFEALRQRLYDRLHHLGIEALAVEDEERCHIPMGTALPRLDQPMLGFGAAAGLVHPATGYQMTRMLCAAPELAQIIANGLRDDRHRDEVCQKAWQTLWPAELRRARQLLVFGRDVLLSFDHEGIGEFFETFFALPADDWQAFMSGVATHRRLSKVMWRMFGSAQMGLRFSLARRAVVDHARVYRALSPFSSDGGAHG